MQCMWKQWLHRPDTSGQSSPGALQSAQQSSNGFRHIPQSSCLAVHFQAATPRKLLILMSIWGYDDGREYICRDGDRLVAWLRYNGADMVNVCECVCV